MRLSNTGTPDFHKPFWQDMYGEPAQKFNAIEGNRLFECLLRCERFEQAILWAELPHVATRTPAPLFLPYVPQ